MDALEEFETKSFVSRLLGKGDVKGLAKKLEEAIPEAKQQELMEHMQKGSMTLRSFRGLIEQVSSMGSMSSVRFQIHDGPRQCLSVCRIRVPHLLPVIWLQRRIGQCLSHCKCFVLLGLHA
jgi:hypothetical protein